jgi:uncharacterized membrane protein
MSDSSTPPNYNLPALLQQPSGKNTELVSAFADLTSRAAAGDEYARLQLTWMIEVLNSVGRLAEVAQVAALSISPPQVILNKKELAVLRVLRARQTPVGQYDLANATRLSRKTVGKCLGRLREIGFVRRILGEREGEVITKGGLDFLSRVRKS